MSGGQPPAAAPGAGGRHEPRAIRPLPWGVTYLGTGDPAVAAAAIEGALARLGMETRRQRPVEGSIRIEGLQRAPWHRVVLRALPQRALWLVEPLPGGGLRLAADYRLVRWYGALTAGLGALVPAGLVAAFAAVEIAWGPQATPASRAQAMLIVPSLLLACVVPLLLGALGGRRTEMAWHEALAEVEKGGGRLEPTGLGLRHSLSLIGYAASLVVVFAWVVGGDLIGPGSATPVALASALLGLGVVALLLLGLAVVMVMRGTVSLRTYPLLGGLASGVAVLFFLALPSPWLAAGLDTEAARSAVGAGGAWLLLGATALVAILGLGLGVYGVSLALPVRAQLERIRALQGPDGVYRRAVAGRPTLHLARAFVGTVWALFAVALLLGLGFDLFAAAGAVAPISDRPALRLAELSAGLTAVAVGLPFDHPLVGAVVRAGWVAYGLAVLALPVLSVGQLVAGRRAAWRRLVAAAATAHPGQAEAEALLASLLGRCPQRVAVRLVVGEPDHSFTGQRRIEAAAHAFGLRTRRRIIEISPEALDRLDRAQLEALLAHELAHHLQGHCAQDTLARWLGRLTFLGDGFAGSLLDSVGFEREADRVAVEVLGVDAGALIRLIDAVAGTAGSDPERPDAQSPRARHRSVLGFLGLRPDLRRRWAWRRFLSEYCGADDLHSWHPSREERIAALLALDSTPSPAEAGGPRAPHSEGENHR